MNVTFCILFFCFCDAYTKQQLSLLKACYTIHTEVPAKRLLFIIKYVHLDNY